MDIANSIPPSNVYLESSIQQSFRGKKTRTSAQETGTPRTKVVNRWINLPNEQGMESEEKEEHMSRAEEVVTRKITITFGYCCSMGVIVPIGV